MSSMKHILIVLVLLGTTALGGYRVFAGNGSAAAAATECTLQDCPEKCRPCPPEACPPTACPPTACTPVACSLGS